MSAKHISHDQAARELIRRGVQTLSRAVKVTLGPRGRNVAIERSFGSPTITKDGVTVAKEIELADAREDLGSQMLREVASKTSDVAGDGTTTATVLAEAIFEQGLRNISAGANPLLLKRGIEKAAKAASAAIAESATKVSGRDDLEKVARISANDDSEVGAVIADAFDEVGQEGVVTVDESQGLSTILEVVKGLEFDRGYLSPNFITDIPARRCELDDALVLFHEKKISSARDLIPALELVAKQNKALLIVAEDVEGDALAMLVVNRIRGTLRCAAVKAPGFGDSRKAMLQDMAAVTGGRAMLEDTGDKLDTVRLEDLGAAKRVVIDKDSTTIIEGAGSRDEIDLRIQQITGEIEKASSSYDKEKLQERLAKLSGGVAKVSVGAATEAEMKERKDRVDDAIHATRAALEEGVVPGGGVALLRASQAITDLGLDGEEAVGAEILQRALEAPCRQIMENAGVNPSVVVHKILSSDDAGFGFDAQALSYGNLLKAGVIDPAKVVRCALENAVSIAALLLTTDVLVGEAPKKSSSSDHGDENF